MLADVLKQRIDRDDSSANKQVDRAEGYDVSRPSDANQAIDAVFVAAVRSPAKWQRVVTASADSPNVAVKDFLAMDSHGVK